MYNLAGKELRKVSLGSIPEGNTPVAWDVQNGPQASTSTWLRAIP